MRRRRARRWTPRGEKQLEESCPLGLGRWACRTGKTCLRKKKRSKEKKTKCPLGLGRWACRTRAKRAWEKKKKKAKRPWLAQSSEGYDIIAGTKLFYYYYFYFIFFKEKSKEALTSTEFWGVRHYCGVQNYFIINIFIHFFLKKKAKRPWLALSSEGYNIIAGCKIIAENSWRPFSFGRQPQLTNFSLFPYKKKQK